ncbi:S24 family peptidase [Pseudorhizobium pelagicum]|uniref:Repressor n=1 Tax=Pseudorhizobium pelagicum TaxID=1509405 RepID=A0A922NZQ3_9HYPH|nr:S24 family peptidase [Pseudorhizobium pelagicum]KEQ05731.1 repressor [Pseudorhizobium pelagicum]KEQ06411.1 repressor [Pseudorhizobium pelagicum]
MSDPQLKLKQWLSNKLEPRGTSAQLAAALGVQPVAVTRMKNVDSDNPKERRQIRPDEIERIARFFNELPPGFEQMTSWLADADTTPPAYLPKSNASFPPRYQQFKSDGYVPLLGQSVAGPNGRFILNGAEVARLFVPPMLEGVEGAYAVRVYGTSMEPRFKAGETVWINPNEPVRAGDDVIVQILTDEENQRESYIKEFKSQSSKVTRLWQHHPDEGETNDLQFPTSQVFSVHKIVFHATV